MATLYANNVAGTLAANIGPSDTLILLAAGQGAGFPAPSGGDYFYATLVHITTGVVEVVQVTGRTGDTLTVVRGRDNTTAVAFTTGSIVELRLTAQMLREIDVRPTRAQPNGLATLDGSGTIPDGQLAVNIARQSWVAANYISLTSFGTPLGVATLDAGGKVPVGQIPALAYIPTTGGSASGTIVSGTSSGEVRVGGQGASQSGVAYRFDGSMAYTSSGVAGPFYTIWNTSNFDPNNKVNVTGGTISGALAVTGNLIANGDMLIRQGSNPARGIAYFGNTNADNIYMDGSNWNFGGGKNVYGNDFISTSDANLKDIVGYLPPLAGISRQVNIAEWTMKADGVAGRGVIAQDVLEYAPQHVIERDGVLHVNKTSLALDLIYDLSARVSRLEEEKC